MKTRRILLPLLVLGMLPAVDCSLGTAAHAQDRPPVLEIASRRPRFLRPVPRGDARGAEQWVDASGAAVFQRHIALSLRNVSRERALQEIARLGRLRLTYSAAVVRLQAPVTLVAEEITLGAALGAVLYDAGIDILLTENARAALVSRSAVQLFRPQGTVVGRVTDTTGRGVANAEVFLDGSRWHTTADTAGRYRLAEVDSGTYTLVARRFGYAKRSRRVTVRADQEETVDLVLPAVAARLDELVTTATGRRRRVDVPNDITLLSADSIMRAAPVRSVTDLLEHRVPGLMAQHTSGAPGDPARLRLRGAASPLRSNDPIVVVDGVRVYAEQSAARSANLAAGNGAGAGSYAAPSPLDYIDPNSIETIEVVKGPSAATLYGQDAANGVIVITTKKGKAGPTLWALSAAHGRTRMAGRYPDLLLRWGHTLYDPVDKVCPITATRCQPDSTKTFQMLNDPALTVLDKGHNTDLHLGVSGGTQSLTYAVNGSYADELGLLRLPDYETERYRTIEGGSPPDWMRRPQAFKQWGAGTNVTARLGSAAEVTLSASVNRSKQQRSPLEQQLDDLMSTFLDRASGRYYYLPPGGGGGAGDGGDLGVPASSYNLSSYRTQIVAAATQFRSGVQANWRPRTWLTLNARAGLDVLQRADELYLPTSRDTLYREGSYSGFSGNETGLLNLATSSTVTSTIDLGGVAAVPLGHGLQFRFASGLNYVGRSFNDLRVKTVDVPYGKKQPGRVEGTSGGLPQLDAQDDATFGWYVAPSLAHPRFAVDLGLRLDGGSTYGGKANGFKLPTFPKLGFSYLLSDESWFPLKDLFQSFRVRTAYGRASRQPGPTDRLRLYDAATPAPGFGDYVELLHLGNVDIRPERTTEFEGGFDADLLDSRLTVTLSGYRKTTDDALIATPVPPSVYGEMSFMRNIGVIRNTGMELGVDAQVMRNSVATWSVRLTVSQQRNKVVRLGPGVLPFFTDSNFDAFGNVSGTRVVPGYPLFGRWTRPVLGYADADGDGVLERSEILLGDTAVYVGRQEPDYELAMFPSVSLWNGALTVTAGLTHTGGLSQKNQVGQRLAPFSSGTNDPTAPLGEQLATGTVASNIDYNWTQTVSMTRFESISIGYRVPVGVARWLGAQRLSVAIQGSNLGLRTNYRGLDPNVNAFVTGNSVTDTGVLPEPRAWRVRLDVAY